MFGGGNGPWYQHRFVQRPPVELPWLCEAETGSAEEPTLSATRKAALKVARTGLIAAPRSSRHLLGAEPVGAATPQQLRGPAGGRALSPRERSLSRVPALRPHQFPGSQKRIPQEKPPPCAQWDAWGALPAGLPFQQQ